jgi:hypothetical protein
MRHSLSDESTRASTVFGSWCGSQHNIVPQEEILTVFKNKSRRLGKGKEKDVGQVITILDDV